MKTNIARFFELRSIVLAFFGAGFLGCAQAAMLGEIQVRSALGERFSASIAVAAADDEDLSANCFRLVSPQDENAVGVLRRAKLNYQYEIGGGRLLVKGDEPQNEPVLTVGVRVKCPGEEERVFQRDYRILLDPAEYRAHIALPNTSSSRAAESPTRVRRKLPALGSAWLTEDGDSVAKIAASYYPGDKAKQKALVEAIYDINPDLPQNTNARLDGDWRILLPLPSAKPTRAPEIAAQRNERLPAGAQTLEALPRLTLGADLPAEATAQLPAPNTNSAVGEFRLRLSSDTLDTERKNTLTPEQTLQLRERLLALESDDQAAQMLQLKYQITELEKKLAQFQSQSPLEPVNKESADLHAWWWALFAMLVLPISFLAWRWNQRRQLAEADLYTQIAPSSTYLHEPRYGASANTHSAKGITLGGLESEEIGTPIHRAHADEWRNLDSDDMDVVAPSNVTEEAQLLLDHGLVPQAINLLNHEIAEMPAALALWMKLFEIFQRNAMTEAFQEKAVAFRLQFASDALWKNVQEMGLTIDPANPMYQSLEVHSELTDVHEPKMGGDQDALEFASALHIEAGLDAPTQMGRVTSENHQAAMDFSADQDRVSEAIELAPAEFIYRSAADERVVDEVQDDVIEIAALPDSGEMLAIQIDEIQAFDPVEIRPEPSAANISQTAAFKSDDPALQDVAQLIESGQRKEAFARLEEMLYKGTMSQRLTASKWLDKMLGTFGHG